MGAVISQRMVKTFKQLNTWSKIFNYLMLAIAVLAMFGWVFEVEFFKRPISGLVAMNPVTSLCFILSSASLLILSKQTSFKKIHFSAYCFPLFVLIISSIKLIDAFTGIEINIDSWLLHDKMLNDISSNVSNSLAPNTALCFIFSSLSILTLNIKQKNNRQISHYFALISGAIAMLSILGYAYQINMFYEALAYFPMAIHTSICFILLTTSLLFFKAERGVMSEFIKSNSAKITAKLLIPSAIAIPFTLGLLRIYLFTEKTISNELATAVMALLIMIIFLVLTWITIKGINKKDELRKKAEQQLLQANKQLEAFSYSVAHDLRTPIRTTNWFSDILLERHKNELSPKALEYLEYIKQSSVSMDQIVNDLLTLSNLGRKKLNPVDINMNALVKIIIDELYKTSEYKAEFVIGDLGIVNADSGLMHQALSNLISNALKYSSKKEKPTIQIYRKEKALEIVYSIKDNGVGFDMKYAHEVFDAFKRLHSPREFKGNGIGLAIVNSIILKHGGKMLAKAKVEEGATFCIILPKVSI